jgi:hypothetical protein
MNAEPHTETDEQYHYRVAMHEAGHAVIARALSIAD